MRCGAVQSRTHVGTMEREEGFHHGGEVCKPRTEAFDGIQQPCPVGRVRQ
jgi:hypothetical protein